MSNIMKFAYNLAKGKKEIFKTKSVWWQNINYFLFDEMQNKKRKRRKLWITGFTFSLWYWIVSHFPILLERKMTVNYNEQILDWKRKTATDPLVLIFREMISPPLNHTWNKEKTKLMGKLHI